MGLAEKMGVRDSAFSAIDCGVDGVATCCPTVPGIAPGAFMPHPREAARASRAALLAERSQDGEARAASSERRAGCPQRASGEAARAASSHAGRSINNHRGSHEDR
jgi:hypothetical protein